MKIYKFIILILFVSLSLSCSKYDKLLKNGTLKERLEAANNYYDKSNYFKALQLYDQLIVELRGSADFEEAYYKYCYCNYNQEQYMAAAYYFKQLAKTLPNGKYAEEALYMAAYCLYLESADAELDQTSTHNALNEFQLFVNKYPESKRIQDCNDIMDQLRFKLETKDYNTAYLYFKIEEYKAAVIAFKNLIKDYPATIYKEQAAYYILKSQYNYALGSILSKKKERFDEAANYCDMFKTQYPNSKYYNEAEVLDNKIKQQLKKLN
ncbi:MAG: outer membrane protein assembly factor BamD [Bacteroidales bacterium]|nr:outer membrane protein assembly factor BamD [Bacteroidales bacterium]